MQPTPRSITLILLVSLALAACTSDGENGGEPNGNGGNATAGTGATGETAPPTPVGVTGASNDTATYEYVNAGLKVTMQVDGTTGTLEVDNGTDHEVGKPGFYLLDATTGAEVDGRVDAGTPVDAGGTGTFDVSFTGIEIRQIGLVVLLLGRDNYGAFVRTA